jgi:hypothetical protein
VLDDTLDLIGDIEIFIAGAGAIVFAVSYIAFFNWRRTPAGRALLYFVLSLIALVLLNALGRWIGHDYPLRVWARLAVYTGIAATVWRLVVVLWRNWRADHTAALNIQSKSRKEKHK